MSDTELPRFLERSGYPRLAYVRTQALSAGAAMPTVIFLPGFRSDMQGTKALYLEAQCKKRGQGFIRFDYSGHGVSAGRFEDCTLESWRDDALSILDRLSVGPVLLVGSSMGGWIGLLLALMRPERVRGFIGIAAAPDFTRDLLEHRFDDTMRASYESRGYAELPNDYSPEPYILTRGLIESGNRLCLLDGRHELPIPVRLLQGLQDKEVSGGMPDAIAACLAGADVQIHLVPDGDHSLSRPEDLALLDQQVEALSRLLSLV
ncbi:MAG: alpha/beta fold hydrolase [Micavibrio sp.]